MAIFKEDMDPRRGPIVLSEKAHPYKVISDTGRLFGAFSNIETAKHRAMYLKQFMGIASKVMVDERVEYEVG